MAVSGMLLWRGLLPSLPCAIVGPPRSLDRLDAERAVAAAARQNHPDRILLALLRERAEEHVDRLARNFRRARLQDQPASLDGRHVIGRADVDVVRLDVLVGPDIGDRHLGKATDDFRQRRRVPARHVGDQHEGHPDIGWHAAKEAFQRLDAARRGADADDGKGMIGGHLGPSGFRRREPQTRVALLP
jgi:hypothetical protein